MTIHKCGGEYTLSMDFCPKCGEQIQMLRRSENEIKAVQEVLRIEFRKIYDIEPIELLVYIHIKNTLAWALGAKSSPLQFITDMKGHPKRDANKNP